MFSSVSNASKFAFIQLVNQLIKEGVVLIDCQVYTDHLAWGGAKMISRKTFKAFLEQNI
jgi:leucyl/phenylalanyl-tRNA--protein transferase